MKYADITGYKLKYVQEWAKKEAIFAKNAEEQAALGGQEDNALFMEGCWAVLYAITKTDLELATLLEEQERELEKNASFSRTSPYEEGMYFQLRQVEDFVSQFNSFGGH